MAGWITPGYNGPYRNNNPLVTFFGLEWPSTFYSGSKIYGAVTDDDTIYIYDNGYVKAYSFDKTLKWTSPLITPRTVTRIFGVTNDQVIIYHADPYTYHNYYITGCSKVDGSAAWSTNLKVTEDNVELLFVGLLFSPEDNKIFFECRESRPTNIYYRGYVSASGGEVVREQITDVTYWVYGGFGIAAPGGGSIYGGGYLEKVAPDLTVAWRIAAEDLLTESVMFSLLGADENNVYVILNLYEGDALAAVSLATGEVLWTSEQSDDYNTAYSIDEDYIFLGSSTGILYKFSKTGTLIGSKTVSSNAITNILSANGYVLTCDGTSTVYLRMYNIEGLSYFASYSISPGSASAKQVAMQDDGRLFVITNKRVAMLAPSPPPVFECEYISTPAQNMAPEDVITIYFNDILDITSVNPDTIKASKYDNFGRTDFSWIDGEGTTIDLSAGEAYAIELGNFSLKLNGQTQSDLFVSPYGYIGCDPNIEYRNGSPVYTDLPIDYLDAPLLIFGGPNITEETNIHYFITSTSPRKLVISYESVTFQGIPGSLQLVLFENQDYAVINFKDIPQGSLAVVSIGIQFSGYQGYHLFGYWDGPTIGDQTAIYVNTAQFVSNPQSCDYALDGESEDTLLLSGPGGVWPSGSLMAIELPLGGVTSPVLGPLAETVGVETFRVELSVQDLPYVPMPSASLNVTFAGVEDDHWYNENRSPDATVTGGVIYKVEMDRDGFIESFSLGDELSEQGHYGISVWARNETEDEEFRIGFYIDKTPPLITTNPVIAEGATIFGDFLLSVTITDLMDDGGTTSTITLDGDPFPSGGVISDGAHVLVVEAEDGAGNQSSLTVNFTVLPYWLRYSKLISIPVGKKVVSAKIELIANDMEEVRITDIQLQGGNILTGWVPHVADAVANVEKVFVIEMDKIEQNYRKIGA